MLDNILQLFVIIFAILINIPSFIGYFVKNEYQYPMEEKIVRFVGSCFLSVACGMLLIFPILFALEWENMFFAWIYPCIAIPYLLERIIVSFSNYFKIITSNNNQIYIRDVFVEYSPAVLSLLLNHKVENKKDFNAIVLNLHAKRIIDFNKVGNQFEVCDLNNKLEILKLMEDEKYVYEVITNKEKFDKQIWHNLIKKQLEKLKFVQKGKKNILLQIAKVYLILFMLVFTLLMLFVLAVLLAPGDFFKNIATNFNFNVMPSIIMIFIMIPIQLGMFELVMTLSKHKYLKDKMDYYTEKGALEMLKWKKFKKFIEDFSMLESAPAESIVIWEKYIAYAMAFNINKSYNSDELKSINKIIEESKWTT